MTDEQRPAPATEEQVKRYLNFPGHISVRMLNAVEAHIDQQRETIAAERARADKAEAERDNFKLEIATLRAEVERLRAAAGAVLHQVIVLEGKVLGRDACITQLRDAYNRT